MRRIVCALMGLVVTASLASAQDRTRTLDMPLGEFKLTVGNESVEGNVEFESQALPRLASAKQEACEPLRRVIDDLHHFAAVDAKQGKGMADALDHIR